MALRVGLFAGWSAFCFASIAEYYFFEEFKSRFNTVAVDYLLFPHEVFVNIWDGGICDNRSDVGHEFYQPFSFENLEGVSKRSSRNAEFAALSRELRAGAFQL